MTNIKPKVIKRLIVESKSGNFNATYQLAKFYQDGMSEIEVDLDKAQAYKKLCAEQLESCHFRLLSLKLIGYKGFENIEVSFSPKSQTTIIIGNNGSGKSSVLEAIQKTLTHISSRLTTRSYNGDQIDELEININSEFSTVIPTFTLGSSLFNLELSQNKSLGEVKKKSKYTEINDFGNIFRTANSAKPDLSFPLFASYTVERANDVTTKDIEKSDEILQEQTWSKSKAYSKSLTGKADFKLFFRWFKEQVESENADDSELKKLKVQIASKEKELESPLLKKLISEMADSPTAKAYFQSYTNELKILKEQLNNYSNVNNNTIDNVREAIYKFLPNFTELKLQRVPLDMLIKKGDDVLSVLQLSQGEKSLLALVADIARRLTLLNPTRDNPLDGYGLVLIDEIDLHLHPSWQQKVVKRLEDTFPNLQFIVTTHSPQVCHTIDSENIWLLKNGTKYKAPRGTRGAVSSWVLKNLFDVDIRPPDDSMTILLNDYKALVYNDKYDEPEAIKAKKTLSDHFGSEYDVLVELDLYIENQEWEKDFEED